MFVGPIYIPTSGYSSSGPATCPHCGKILPQDSPTTLQTAGIALGCIVAVPLLIWAVGVFLDWIDSGKTLTSILADNWRFFVVLLGRIW